MLVRKPHIAYRDTDPITHGSMLPVRIVLHDTESHDTQGITDISGVYAFWHTQGQGYGAHFVIDAEGNIGQGARCDQITWHVGNLNTGSIGIEQIGFASFTKLAWKRRRRQQILAVAHTLAWAHDRWNIPLKTPSDPHDAGVTTHRLVGAAGIDPSGHTDPGTGYPLWFTLYLAKLIVKTGWAPVRDKWGTG